MDRPQYRPRPKSKAKLAKPFVGEIGPNGRDPISGKFAANNTFSMGRAPGFRHRMSEAFLSAFSEEDMIAFANQLKKSANRGSYKALRIILERILGPAHAVFIAGLHIPDGGYSADDRFL